MSLRRFLDWIFNPLGDAHHRGTHSPSEVSSAERESYSRVLTADRENEMVALPSGFDQLDYFHLFEGQALKDLLDRIVTPIVEPLGLRWRGDYYWIGESEGGIRKVLHYTLLRGRGTFTWGVCLDFVKMPSGNKLVFNRTYKAAKLHLFERAPGYVASFYGTYIGDGEGTGVCSHARHHADRTISQSIAFLLNDIRTTFERMSTLDGVIAEAERQIAEIGRHDNIYRHHSPPPAYVLAFLYSEAGRHQEALATLDSIRDEQDFYKLEMVRDYLERR